MQHSPTPLTAKRGTALNLRRSQAGFASAAAAALLAVFTLVLGNLALMRLTREQRLVAEQAAAVLTETQGQTYHRLICNHVKSGEFGAIFSNHVQSRLENPKRGNNVVVLAMGRDPVGSDADIFFNTVYLLPKAPPVMSTDELNQLPPAAGRLVDEYQKFRRQSLIQTRFVSRITDLPGEVGFVPFAYVVEATVKTKVTGDPSPAPGEVPGLQENVSRFLLTVRPAQPPSIYEAPRPVYVPPYPALFAR